jgi:hypothetical protein
MGGDRDGTFSYPLYKINNIVESEIMILWRDSVAHTRLLSGAREWRLIHCPVNNTVVCSATNCYVICSLYFKLTFLWFSRKL